VVRKEQVHEHHSDARQSLVHRYQTVEVEHSAIVAPTRESVVPAQNIHEVCCLHRRRVTTVVHGVVVAICHRLGWEYS
jgi:hypothetical protein